jgi:hypothetical protein
MNVAAAWLRIDLRRRWRSLTVLVLLIAVAGATVMAALAGARRGASSLQRLQAHTLPATSAILANSPGFDWRPIRALPEVEALTTFVVDYTISSIGIPSDDLSFPPGDAETMRTVEKPVVFSGRVFDPARADEAVITPGLAEKYHKSVGSTVLIQLPTPAEIASQSGSGPNHSYTGPRVTVHIVGVIKSLWFSDQPGGNGQLVLSPGMIAKYRENIVGSAAHADRSLNYVNALVRLRGGERAIPQLREDVARITGRSDIDVWNLPEQARSIQHQLAFEARCLLAFGLVALVAALFLVGQAIVRFAAASTSELQTLRALGMSPRQAIGTAAAAPVIAGVLGALLAAALAGAASRVFPIGTASLLEPAPGTSVDWLVLGSGVVVFSGLVCVGAASAAWLALGAARRSQASRRSTVALAVARAGFPVPVVVGTRFALESGRGRTAVPVRPALIGAVAGVLGILAAFTFSRGVDDAVSHPERFGQTFQAVTFMGVNGQDFGPAGAVLKALTAEPNVTGFDDGRTAVATGPGGKGSVSLWNYSGGSKKLPVVVTSGRMPEAANEVALAPRSLRDLHTSVGAQLELNGNRKRMFTVTGTALVPAGPHNGYADGGWVADSGYDALFTGYKYRIVLVTLRPSARGPHAAAALTAAVTKRYPQLKGVEFENPDPLTEMAQLREVRGLPIALGIFLVLLAVGAVGHALATAVRRRAHDIAVLRALGMTQWQCRWVVVTQATLLALIGLLFGVPLGLAAGRVVWRTVADYTPLQYVAPVAAWAMLLIGPAALLLANLLAAWPGRRAARLRISHILRTE